MQVSSRHSLAERVRSILALRGLSLADVSRASRSLIPGDRLSFIPHNFYSSLRNQRFSPRLKQLVALSTVSGYRLIDWLTVFGFSLDDVPRFQLSLPATRTVELDDNVYQPRTEIPWFYDLKETEFSVPLIPLSQWLAPGRTRRYGSLSNASNSAYRYVKIGSEDALAFPDLLPGSIVRVSREVIALEEKSVGRAVGKSLFLVGHSNGLTCSRLHRSGPEKLVLCSRQLPYAPVELHEGTEAVVLGVADIEIRRLNRTEGPLVPARLGRFWTPAPLLKYSSIDNVGELIRRARKRSGLSFREASKRTRFIAKKLGDSRYYCSPAALSDYEARKFCPRHIHKMISISAVYFGSVAQLLETAGAGLDQGGQLSMPDDLVGIKVDAVRSSSKSSRFMNEMARRFKRLPYFLNGALSHLFGLTNISVRDVFWAGGAQGSIHSYSAGALFLVVDRKQKIPRPSLSSPMWAQPAYVLQLRDGGYLWGFCSLERHTLIVRACTAGSPKLQRFRNRVDAEVIGKVVGIVRTLKSDRRTTKKS